MERVLDPILKNLPSQMSFSHWRVGPMQGDFEVNNDLRVTELKATGEYNLMDEQVAMATAAAAAAMAIEHENQRRNSYQRMGHISNQERLRAFAATLPQQRERMGEVIQEIRERAPEMIQNIRQRTPQLLQGIRERTPEVLMEIKEKTPEMLYGIREYVRERVLQKDDISQQYDCDASGRRISNTASYNNSLNEEEEPREQPPLSSFQGSRLQMHCNEAWKRLYPPKQEPSEYYVNFEDGNAQEAVNHVVNGGRSGPAPKAIISVSSDYTDMNDPLDVSARHAPLKLDPAEHYVHEKHPVHSKPQHKWGAVVHDEEKEASACEEKSQQPSSQPPEALETDSGKMDQEEGANNNISLHSTAKYQWSAPSKASLTEEVRAAPVKEVPKPSNGKLEVYNLSGDEEPTDDSSSSEDDDLQIDAPSTTEDNESQPPKEPEQPVRTKGEDQQAHENEHVQQEEDLIVLEEATAQIPAPEPKEVVTTSIPQAMTASINEDFDA